MTNKHVLIVEDDELLTKKMGSVFFELGYIPFVTKNIPDSISYLRKMRPDVIIVNLVLKDGLGTTIIDIHDYLYPKSPTKIILSSTVEHTSIIGYIEHKILIKPFSMVTLKNSLTTHST